MQAQEEINPGKIVITFRFGTEKSIYLWKLINVTVAEDCDRL